MSQPTPRFLRPISFEEAHERRREALFIEEWVNRLVRANGVDPSHLEELRGSAAVGGAKGMADWRALPGDEQTLENRSAFVARGIVNAVSAFVRELHGREKGKRAQALSAATFDPDDNTSIEARFQGFCANANHQLYAGLLHDTLGLESPEDLYIKREQQELDLDKAKYALSRLEDPAEREFAELLLIEEWSFKDAAAAVGIHDRSKARRLRDRVYKQLRQHTVVFASSVAPRRDPGGNGQDPR